jgi:hypothetical protein
MPSDHRLLDAHVRFSIKASLLVIRSMIALGYGCDADRRAAFFCTSSSQARFCSRRELRCRAMGISRWLQIMLLCHDYTLRDELLEAKEVLHAIALSTWWLLCRFYIFTFTKAEHKPDNWAVRSFENKVCASAASSTICNDLLSMILMNCIRDIFPFEKFNRNNLYPPSTSIPRVYKI